MASKFQSHVTVRIINAMVSMVFPLLEWTFIPGQLKEVLW